MADQQQISPEKKAQAGGGMSIIGIALNIAMLALGVRAYGSCPAEPMIPVYMIGCGATNLSLLVFSITTSILIHCCCPDEAGEGETACCGLPSLFKKGKVMIEKLLNATIGLGSFIWLVIGSIYVFGVDPISFEDPKMPDYCDYAPYMYAYVMTIIGWIGMVLAAVLVVCCCPVLCCVGIAASAAGLSLKSAAAADGTTGDSAESKASPKDAKDEEEMVGMTQSS